MNIAMGRCCVSARGAPARCGQPSGRRRSRYGRTAPGGKHTNLDDVIVDREQSTVYFADPYLRLDVGAVAKGFAVERVARRPRRRELKRSHQRGRERPRHRRPGRGGDPWAVSVRKPNGGSLHCERFLSSLSSGGYIRRFTMAGEEYHHIISPETLMPSRHFLASLSAAAIRSGGRPLNNAV